eukprot:scaffold878_cov271-Pinguiococcus_pyrenoidosus.AAC.46
MSEIIQLHHRRRLRKWFNQSGRLSPVFPALLASLNWQRWRLKRLQTRKMAGRRVPHHLRKPSWAPATRARISAPGVALPSTPCPATPRNGAPSAASHARAPSRRSERPQRVTGRRIGGSSKEV